MADLYYTAFISKYNHYKDINNYSRCNEESYEIRKESLEALQETLLCLIKGETEPDMFGEYTTYEWSDIVLIQELERSEIKRRDIPGYAEYMAEKERLKKEAELAAQARRAAASEVRDAKLYQELMAKYPDGIPGAS